MPPLDFLEAIADEAQKIVIGGDDLAAGRELNDSLNAQNRGDLSLKFRGSQFLCGDVSRDGDNFRDDALWIDDRVVRRL